MNKITPQTIIERTIQALKDREETLKNIAFLGNGYEQWIKWEILQTFLDICAPIAYSGGRELKAKGEKLADIGVEYTLYNPESKKVKRADLFIVNEPFLHPCVDENWNILNSNKEIMKKEYSEVPTHYIFLKTTWWNIKNDWGPKSDSCRGLMDDINTIKKLIQNTSSIYNTKSFIELAVCSVWAEDSNKRSYSPNRKEISKFFENQKTMFPVGFEADINEITTGIYLISVFFELESTKK